MTTTNAAGVSTPLITEPTLFDTDATGDWFAGTTPTACAAATNTTMSKSISSASAAWPANTNRSGASTGSLGFRYFRFQESLEFASLRQGGSWDVGNEWAYLNDRVENNLWGFQIGANADVRLTQTIKLFFTPKVGIYDNHIESHFAFARGDGVVANTGGAYPGLTYPVNSSTDKVSFLTELNLGLDWQFSCASGAPDRLSRDCRHRHRPGRQPNPAVPGGHSRDLARRHERPPHPARGVCRRDLQLLTRRRGNVR